MLSPTSLTATDVGSTGNTATTQPIAKPAPTPTAPTTQPAGSPVSAIPLAPSTPSAPAAPAAPTTPPPLTTSDPLAFQPAPTQPYTVPGGSTFIGGTQTTDANGNVTNPGILGTQFVPGTNGMLVDGGNGMFAPTPGVDVSNGVLQIADPIITQGYQAPGTVTSMGKIIGMTYDANGNPQPLYDSGTTDPNVAPTQASAPTTSQLLSAIVNGTSAAPGAPQPNSTTGTGAPGANGTLIPANRPMLTAGSPSSPAPGTPNDVTPSTPSTGFSGALGGIIGGASSPPSGGAPGSSSSFAPGVNLTPTTVDNALTNDTISPGNSIDRVKLAQDALNSTIQNVLDPQFQANERDLNRYNFGAGRGVSGDARTSQGTLASDYNRQKTNLADTLLNSATNGSIEDLYRNIGIAQQQQAFQAGQQGTAFNQSLQQLLAGSQGDPSQIAMMLAGIFGSQGSGISNALGQYAAQSTANNNNANLMTYLYPYIYGGADTSQTDPIINGGVPPVRTTPGGGY